MAHLKPSPGKWHLWRIHFSRPQGSQFGSMGSQPSLVLLLQTPWCISTSPALHLQHQLQHWGCSPRAQGAHSQCEPSWFGVKEHTEALWVGAAFPMDDLQLLPASSSPRWIILLCQVCNYSLCHLPGWAMGAGGRMFVLNLTSWVLGAAGRAMEMQWGKRC